MSPVNLLEAKRDLTRLVDAIESGAETEIVITRDGCQVARLVSIIRTSTANRLGLMDGKWAVPDKIFDYETETNWLFGSDAAETKRPGERDFVGEDGELDAGLVAAAAKPSLDQQEAAVERTMARYGMSRELAEQLYMPGRR